MFYSGLCFGFWAWLLIIIGVLALLTNFGILTTVIWKWWPILFIIFGIYIFVLRRKRKKIMAGHIFHKIASSEKIQEKIKKIIDTVDEIVDKKLDEWHEEATKDERSRRK